METISTVYATVNSKAPSKFLRCLLAKVVKRTFQASTRSKQCFTFKYCISCFTASSKYFRWRLQVSSKQPQLYIRSANLQMIELIFKFAILSSFRWLISVEIQRIRADFQQMNEKIQRKYSRKQQLLLCLKNI